MQDTETKQPVKSVLLQPEAIFKDSVKDVIHDGFTTSAKICTSAALKQACSANGISG